MTREYTDPPMGDMAGRAGAPTGIMTGMAGMTTQVDHPTTALEDHAQQLESLLGGLERAALQYDNMLNRLRGGRPTTDDATEKHAEPVGTLDRIHLLSDRLNNMSSRLNNAADELNGLI